jgi:hypothetical protein
MPTVLKRQFSDSYIETCWVGLNPGEIKIYAQKRNAMIYLFNLSL